MNPGLTRGHSTNRHDAKMMRNPHILILETAGFFINRFDGSGAFGQWVQSPGKIEAPGRAGSLSDIGLSISSAMPEGPFGFGSEPHMSGKFGHCRKWLSA